jgi:hypothetical protein
MLRYRTEIQDAGTGMPMVTVQNMLPHPSPSPKPIRVIVLTVDLCACFVLSHLLYSIVLSPLKIREKTMNAKLIL